jgi:hypothetical protein
MQMGARGSIKVGGNAQGSLERISQSIPAAISLAQTVATLALRVGGMG